MAISKPKKPHPTPAPTPTIPTTASPEDLDRLKSEVASFASSLGLAPLSSSAGGGGGGGGGFDDSDFRKPGAVKPPKTLAPDPGKPKKDDDRDLKPKPKPKPHPLQIDPFDHEGKKGLPTYPLMKASSLSGQWYVDAEEVEARVLGQEGRKKALAAAAAAMGIEEMKGLVARKKEVAERLMRQYVGEYEQSRRKSGDMKLLEVTTRSGTSADKVSAFTCLVEDNPIANLRSLDALLSMVTSKVGKRYAFTGFEALKELFLSRLLPDRKLKCLFQRPLDILPDTKDGFSLILFWHWEECLKQRYEKFVIALEEALKDMLPSLKDKAIKTVFILLKSKSEQERRLLTALVNKLGDPERKAASGAGYHLSCLLSAHPNMKAVVIDEVDSFLFRPHVGLRSKYQAVNFLSQILLSKKGDGPKIAKRLADVYFALFKVLISESHGGEVHKKNKDDRLKGKKKGKREKVEAPGSHQNNNNEPSPESNVEMDSRLLSALLTGVNRAFPFISSDEADDIIEVQTPVLFRLVHSENFNVGVQALMLLYQISSKNQIASDRFYRALYSKLLSPSAVTSSKPELFLGLLVKAMKNDINLKRVAAFSKRLLQVALQRPPQYACGCLFILSEVLKAKPPLWTMVLQNESVDDDLEHFEDIIESPEDLTVAPSGNAINSDGLPASFGDKKLIDSTHGQENHDLEVEVGFENRSKTETASKGDKEENNKTDKGSILPSGYNPRHREPSFCNADRASWWELTALASHVHPSVATMARTLLSGANIVYNGDPLNDLSLTAFLDKFMEKKPKVNRKAEGIWHGGSQIAPARKLDLSHHFIGDEILQLAEDEVPPEDVIFHRFYMNKTGSSKRLKAKKPKTSVDDEDAELLLDGSDESDEEIDRMLGSGRTAVEEPEGEYDYDDLDQVAEEDDDDLLGDGSDAEAGPAPNQNRHDDDDNGDTDDDDDGGGLAMWDDVDEEHDDGGGGGDDDDNDEYGGGDRSKKKKTKGKKLKLEGSNRASPFASLEDYEHLMDSDEQKTNKSKKTKQSKSQKKRKRSK